MVMILADVAVYLIFYVLLRPVSHTLALLAAFFRLAQAATLGINLLNLFFGLQPATGANYLTALGADQQHELALLFLSPPMSKYFCLNYSASGGRWRAE